jgi:hypothetical protein
VKRLYYIKKTDSVPTKFWSIQGSFQWMVISVCFDNLKFWGQFLCPILCDGSHHHSVTIHYPIFNEKPEAVGGHQAGCMTTCLPSVSHCRGTCSNRPNCMVHPKVLRLLIEHLE